MVEGGLPYVFRTTYYCSKGNEKGCCFLPGDVPGKPSNITAVEAKSEAGSH